MVAGRWFESPRQACRSKSGEPEKEGSGQKVIRRREYKLEEQTIDCRRVRGPKKGEVVVVDKESRKR